MRSRVSGMRVSIGCRLRYSFPQPTPLIALLNVHYSRFGDLERADYLVTSPSVPSRKLPGWLRQLVHARPGSGGRLLPVDGWRLPRHGPA